MSDSKKIARYHRIFRQLQDLLTKTNNPVSRMATVNAVLHHKMDGFFWTGFYLLEDGDLRVGPYQGPVACQILEKDKGVCWAAINSGKSVVVEDVELFPGHIACDSRSKSEIAIPVFDTKGKIAGVLDVDSKEKANFNSEDAQELEKIVSLIYVK
ncbi:MAG: GAF domain-containing protein [Bacteroidales bacterium]|nr:GAF domain-containing protein [Bacteroidales bacterium]